MKILIGGAGIAGLAIGWRLAEAGCAVEIFERGIAGRGATWASAGMLAPGAEFAAEDSAMARFARRSRAAWPHFRAELERAAGIDIGYRECGTLIVAETDAALADLQTRAEALRHAGEEAAVLGPEELHERAPMLSQSLVGALLVPADAQADNRALGPALMAAARRAGATIRENCAICSVLTTGGHARGFVTDGGLIEGDAVVLALGAWMNRIPGTEALSPIAPVKGQMAALAPVGTGGYTPRALVWSEDIYIVPRERRIVLGATVEEAGFDLSVSREARDRLAAAAIRIVPALRDWRVSESWAGLRPRTPDLAPVLGSTALPGLYIAGGQYRNGILFAPLVAELMAGILLGRERADPAFDPDRFAGP
jgi:glycine oxidase